ncbi:MAG: sialidase family protein, partial [Planctomycetota bacterium]|nr:sialidase family protein [Planctomycetota bacterium]
MILATNQTLLICFVLIGVQDGGSTTRPDDGHSAVTGSAVKTSGVGIHAARSEDGIKFDILEEPVFRSACHPTLVRTAGDELLVVFERRGKTDGQGERRLAAIRSRDDGETWSAPEGLDLSVPGIKGGSPRHPALVRGPNGQLTLMFVCADHRGRDRLYCARSTDGKKFEDLVRLTQRRGLPAIVDPAGFFVGQTCHVFGLIADQSGRAYLGVRNEGRRLKRIERPRVSDIGRPGCVIPAKKGFRLYGTSVSGIVSAFSEDGREWSREPGVRLASGFDPTVARLSNGRFLMLYVVERASSRVRKRSRDRAEQSDREVTLYEVGEVAEPIDPMDGESLQQEDRVDPVDAEDVGSSLDGPAEEGGPSDSSTMGLEEGPGAGLEIGDGDGDALSAGLEDATGEQESEAADVLEQAELIDGVDSDRNSVDFEPLYTEDGLPIPDFRHPVNYRRWLEERYASIPASDNAADYYRRLMPYPGDDTGDKPAWPDLVNMYSDASHAGPPGPWDPAEHPDWDASTQAGSELLGLFSEAAAVPNYVTEPFYPEDSPNDLLLNILLPHLSGQRKLVKQVLSDAWRAPEGRPDPDLMLEAFDTCLSSAEHYANGEYLIEKLVSIAEKKMIHESAMQALKHEVFSPEQMETAIELLAKKDRPLPDAGDWVRGELMSSMDVTQYVFGPVSPDREPSLNPERIAEFNKAYDSEEWMFPPPTEEELAQTTAEGTLQGFRDYYREYADMVRRGYPEVRPADLDRVQQAFVEGNYVAKQIAPSLSRVYALSAQYEASRRATQLTYAIHLHKSRTGNWPASLDELPERYAGSVRTDPFSGEDFAYRLTAEGPLLYS